MDFLAKEAVLVGASVALTEMKQEQQITNSLDPERIWTGGVVAIKGDGNCCYHLAGVLALLCRNPDALLHGAARCLDTDIMRAREQILQNFRSWLSESCGLSSEQLEELVQQTTGDFIKNFETRTCGKAVGEARLGSYTDLAVFTRREDIRVVVILH